MKINIYNSSDSQQNPNLTDYDQELLEYMIDQYGAEALFNTMNEATYYGTGGRFDRTGGSRVHGVSGLLQSLPSFAMTSIVCWPLSLFVGVSALIYRFQKKFEDNTSWMNRLDPRFWVDYLANSKDSKSSGDDSWKKRVRETLFGKDSKVKTAVATGAGAAAGVLGGGLIKDAKDAKKAAVNAAFIPYWITLSNGEILRLRADSEEHAKAMANMIIAYTEKPVYGVLNQKIDAGNSRYTFYFDDGEKCYWSAPSQEQAFKEATDTRLELCNTMNKMMPGVVKLDNLDKPRPDGKVEVSRTEKIDPPIQNKFLNITTTQPIREKPQIKDLPKPVYKYGSLDNFRANYANFIFNVPSYNDGEAKDIIREVNARNRYIELIYDRMNKKYDLYRVAMKDGDIYIIPGESVNDVSDIALKLYDIKDAAIKKVLQDSALEEYEDFLTDYKDQVRKVKDVKKFDPEKNYTIKKGDEAGLVKISNKDERIKYPTFRL